jgi:hypothetical protein
VHVALGVPLIYALIARMGFHTPPSRKCGSVTFTHAPLILAYIAGASHTAYNVITAPLVVVRLDTLCPFEYVGIVLPVITWLHPKKLHPVLV